MKISFASALFFFAVTSLAPQAWAATAEIRAQLARTISATETAIKAVDVKKINPSEEPKGSEPDILSQIDDVLRTGDRDQALSSVRALNAYLEPPRTDWPLSMVPTLLVDLKNTAADIDRFVTWVGAGRVKPGDTELRRQWTGSIRDQLVKMHNIATKVEQHLGLEIDRLQQAVDRCGGSRK